MRQQLSEQLKYIAVTLLESNHCRGCQEPPALPVKSPSPLPLQYAYLQGRAVQHIEHCDKQAISACCQASCVHTIQGCKCRIAWKLASARLSLDVFSGRGIQSLMVTSMPHSERAVSAWCARAVLTKAHMGERLQADPGKLRALISLPSLIDTIRLHYWTAEGPDAAERACCSCGTEEDVKLLRKGLLDIAALIWRTPAAAQPAADSQQVDMQARSGFKSLV